MPNHVHWIVSPHSAEAPAEDFGRARYRYSHCFQAQRTTTGRLWPIRLYNCPPDCDHLMMAMSYVEQNPVRAGFVETAEACVWASDLHLSWVWDEWDILDLAAWEEICDHQPWRQILNAAATTFNFRQARLTSRTIVKKDRMTIIPLLAMIPTAIGGDSDTSSPRRRPLSARTIIHFCRESDILNRSRTSCVDTRGGPYATFCIFRSFVYPHTLPGPACAATGHPGYPDQAVADSADRKHPIGVTGGRTQCVRPSGRRRVRFGFDSRSRRHSTCRRAAARECDSRHGHLFSPSRTTASI